jgi:hypothetical protein
MTGSHMCTDGRKLCTDSRKFPELGMAGFDGFLMGLDFTKSKVDYNLCDKINDDDDPIHYMLMDMGGS